MHNIEIYKGDLTTLNIDIIVNAANNTLLGGGGVDGTIHRKAGINLRIECSKLGGCKTGEAKITDAYNLPCKKIIHTVGPIYGKNYEEGSTSELLSNCYKKSLKLAEEYRKETGLDSVTIGFPCISTGAYGYPKDDACKVAIESVKSAIKEEGYERIKVIFVCYDEEDFEIYKKEIRNVI